jgi:hypothetical protein
MEMGHAGLNTAGPHAAELNIAGPHAAELNVVLQLECKMTDRQFVR